MVITQFNRVIYANHTFVVIQLPLLYQLKHTSRYKSYVYRSVAYFLNRFILRLKLEVEGLENVPKDGRLTIYANHKSYADPVVLMKSLIDQQVIHKMKCL